jgi:hypothetical protein
MYINVKKTSLTIILSIIAIGAFCFFYQHQKNSTNKNLGLYTKTFALYSAQGTASIPQLQEVVNISQKNGTFDDIASAKILLAIALFDRNQGNDRQQAATTLKEIASDANLLTATRSSAYSYMANWFFTYGSQDLMKRYVFDTSPYKEYLAEQRGDVSEATVFLLTLANNLQANTFNNYESAGILAYKLRGMDLNASNKDQQEVASRAYRYLVAGDDLFQDSQKSEFYIKNPSAFLFLLSTKSISLATLQPFFPDSITNTKVTDSFETALGSIKGAQDSLSAKYLAPNIRLEYAIWLSQAKNIADLDNKIRDVVEPINAAQSQIFNNYIQRIRNRTTKSYTRKGVIRVAFVSPSFKTYLKSQGWQESDFTSK